MVRKMHACKGLLEDNNIFKMGFKDNKVAAVVVSVFDWYPSHYPQNERRLLRKLDLAILVFGCLSCEQIIDSMCALLTLVFCRFLGQQNITNAFVSGMREDLGAYGNELNYYNVACELA